MAPANPTVTLMVSSLWTSSATLKNSASRISPAQFDLVHKAAVAACDAEDGVTDGIVSAPLRCGFDPAVLQCKGADAGSTTCLTEPQVTAMRAIYQGPHNPRTGQAIFPGFEPGSEAMLPIQVSGELPFVAGLSYFRDLVFEDSKWDFRAFDYDKDVTRAIQAHSAATDIPSDGLETYLASGRKLLLFARLGGSARPSADQRQFLQGTHRSTRG
ncbi:MAG TPA: tannase/feruloyl esterase family alpha/beta hydrolase [Steroidobacteraceae bacterium]|jgi:feruloyl esterase